MNPTLQRKSASAGPNHKKGDPLASFGERPSAAASEPSEPPPAGDPDGAGHGLPSPTGAARVADESPRRSPRLLQLFRPSRGEVDPASLLGVRPPVVHRLLLAPRADPDGAPLYELPHAGRLFPERDLGRSSDLPFGPARGPDPATLSDPSERAFATEFADAPARRAKPRATGRVGSPVERSSPVGRWSEIPASQT